MKDINSGVTYLDEGLIILWRLDHDLWKTLIHELTHLMAQDRNEADTEARALDMWCMYRAESYAAYLILKQQQIERSRETARKMRTVDAGLTNAVRYFVDGAAILEGRIPRGCPECRSDGGAAEDLVLTL